MPKRNKTQAAMPRDAELQAIYARIRREFSAADLQKYAEIEEGVPAEQVLKEMEEIQRRLRAKNR